jgi:hypothetical protein
MPRRNLSPLSWAIQRLRFLIYFKKYCLQRWTRTGVDKSFIARNGDVEYRLRRRQQRNKTKGKCRVMCEIDQKPFSLDSPAREETDSFSTCVTVGGLPSSAIWACAITQKCALLIQQVVIIPCVCKLVVLLFGSVYSV